MKSGKVEEITSVSLRHHARGPREMWQELRSCWQWELKFIWEEETEEVRSAI